MNVIKKIVAIGPESTGKSTLSSRLAAHYHTHWVPEYAREYLETHGADYTFEDLKRIAAGQLALEDQWYADVQQQVMKDKKKHPLLFIDTDLYVIKVWGEYVFNACDNSILREIAKRKYDGYLLCHPDLEWQPDALREYPDLKIREELFCYYKDLLTMQSVPWCNIYGNHEERFERAVSFVNAV